MTTTTDPTQVHELAEYASKVLGCDFVTALLAADALAALLEPDGHVFGPEYHTLASRVPVDGDLLLSREGIFKRSEGVWVLRHPYSAVV